MTAHQKNSEQVILLLYVTENTISSLKLMSVMVMRKSFLGNVNVNLQSCEEKTLFVIDRPTLIVRIITSLKPLINYLMILQSISKAFGIHYKNLGFDNAETLRDAIGTSTQSSVFH